MNKTLFLDRDGIINVDHGYVHTKEKFKFVDGIFELCRYAQELGYQIIVITNQAGIARGMYSVEDFLTLSKWMKEQFIKEKVIITDVYFCPHHPKKGFAPYKVECECRKPKPGMIFEAAKKHNIDLKQSVFIGDKVSDIKAAENAGIHNRIMLTGKYADDGSLAAHRITKIKDAMPFID